MSFLRTSIIWAVYSALAVSAAPAFAVVRDCDYSSSVFASSFYKPLFPSGQQYQNLGGTHFRDVTRYAGVGHLDKGHGVTFVDLDGDGDLEIYSSVGGFWHGDFGANALYRNELGSQNHWLEVTLKQPSKNRFAVGASVWVRVGRLTPRQDVSAGHGFGSTDPARLHFGLAAAATYDAIEVRWPDATRERFPGGVANQRLELVRGGGVSVP